MWEKLTIWFNSILILIASGIKLTVDAAVIAIVLAISLVIVDFITGIVASHKEGLSITSRKLRWSCVKMAVYTGFIGFTMLIGALLHAAASSSGSNMGADADTILHVFMYITQVMAYAICWIELVSIVENSMRIFKSSLFLQFLHWVLTVEIIKKIPKLGEFLKEKDAKNLCNDFESINKENEK